MITINQFDDNVDCFWINTKNTPLKNGATCLSVVRQQVTIDIVKKTTETAYEEVEHLRRITGLAPPVLGASGNTYYLPFIASTFDYRLATAEDYHVAIIALNIFHRQHIMQVSDTLKMLISDIHAKH